MIQPAITPATPTVRVFRSLTQELRVIICIDFAFSGRWAGAISANVTFRQPRISQVHPMPHVTSAQGTGQMPLFQTPALMRDFGDLQEIRSELILERRDSRS